MPPHDAKRPAFDDVVVQGIESTLGVLGAGKVDVSVAERHARNMVTKHADGVDGANDGEDVEEMLLANVLVQVADVQRGGRRGGTTVEAGAGTASICFSCCVVLTITAWRHLLSEAASLAGTASCTLQRDLVFTTR